MLQTKHYSAHAQRGKSARQLRIIKAAQHPSSVERLRRHYDRHLGQVAGLTEATRSVYWLFIRQFLQWRFGRRPLRVEKLRAEEVNGFIHERGQPIAWAGFLPQNDPSYGLTRLRA